MTAETPNTASVVADLVKRFYDPQVRTVGFDMLTNEAEVLLLPEGIKPHSVKPFLDEFRTRPERRQGTAQLHTLDSLIAHANRFKDTDSVLYAVRDMNKPSLTAVLDYHPAGGCHEALPRFGRHRGHYTFPLSEEWRTWTAASGKTMDQAEFAAFLEEHLVDVIPPPDFAHAEDEWTRELGRMVMLLGGGIADPLRLAELARGITIRADDRAEQQIDLASGPRTLAYKSTHVDDAGQQIKVPSLFLVAVPVFDGGQPYALVAKLRYRLTGGGVKWAFDLQRPDRVFRHVFDRAAERAATETGLPLLYGIPE